MTASPSPAPRPLVSSLATGSRASQELLRVLAVMGVALLRGLVTGLSPPPAHVVGSVAPQLAALNPGGPPRGR